MEIHNERYTYDIFENCPACNEWRMRVRVKVCEWTTLNGMVRIDLRPTWYSFDLRCLNCGYSNRILELDPLSFEEEELQGVLKRERHRLVDKMVREMRRKVEQGEAIEVTERRGADI